MFGMIPFTREENSLWNYLDNMEKNLFTGFGDMSQFRCDIQDKGDHYLMEAELPGFQKEDISLDLNGDNMVITARHNSEKEEKGEGNYLRRERKYGSYSRSFNVSGILAKFRFSFRLFVVVQLFRRIGSPVPYGL